MLQLAARNLSFAQFFAGRPVQTAKTGQTPYAVIHRQNKASVHYVPPRGAAARAPVFLVMPLINNWTIFDLLPGRSVVQALSEAGVPVYLLDWGRPGPEDAEVGVSDLLDGLLHRSIDRAARHAAAQVWAQGSAPPMDAVGYCVGGTFLAIYLARHSEKIRRAAFVATPVDFHRAGALACWVKPGRFPLDQLVDGYGNYPGALIKGGFVTLKPMNEAGKYISLWERDADPAFRALWAAMEQWAGDSIDFPGEAYREYVRACYFDNSLMPDTPRWTLAGERVELKQAKIPALALASARDHIVPPAAAFGLESAWGGPVKTQLVEGGHVGMAVGRALPAALLAWSAEG